MVGWMVLCLVNSILGEEGHRKLLMIALFLCPQYNQDTGKFGFKCELPQENLSLRDGPGA